MHEGDAADTSLRMLDPAVQTMLTYIGGVTLVATGIVAVVSTARVHLARSLDFRSRRELEANDLPTIDF
jgi:hypothetical protein